VAKQRFESSVTAVSWIPSEAISGPSKIPFNAGITHYDDPPPDRLDDLEQLRTSDRFREANELRAFIEVDGGRIVNAGHLGQGHIGATTVPPADSLARIREFVTDHPAGSHSPLKLVNPPVGLMFLEAAPRLLASGVSIPKPNPCAGLIAPFCRVSIMSTVA
jgi:hypothetical protein